MVKRLFFAVGILASGSALSAEPPYSSRFLSVEADDITQSFAERSAIEALVRSFVSAWVKRDSASLEPLVSAGLFATARQTWKAAGPAGGTDAADIRDLAIMKFRGDLYVQWDDLDRKTGQVTENEAWYLVQKAKGRWIIAKVLTHFDPDAGP